MATRPLTDADFQDDPKFDDIVSFTMGPAVEGGYTVDHAGPTNRGVTQDTFDGYRKSMDLEPRDVKTITENEAIDVYASEYYEKPKIDTLPHKVAGVVFDYGVNSHPRKAIKDLQAVVGVKQDGDLGPKTQAAVQSYVDTYGEDVLAGKVIDKRQQFMNGLIQKNPAKYKRFENGWNNRLKMLRDKFAQVGDSVNPFRVGEAQAADVLTDADFADEPADAPTDVSIDKPLTDSDFMDSPQIAPKGLPFAAIGKNIGEIAKGTMLSLQGMTASTGGLIDMIGQNMRFDRNSEEYKVLKQAGGVSDADEQHIDRVNKAADKVSEWGKTAKSFWQNASQKGRFAHDPEMFRGSFMDNPSWTRAASIVAEAVPQLGAATAMSVATGSPIIGLSFIGAMEGEQTFAEARTDGTSLEKANALFAASAVGAALLEKLPLERFLKGGTGKKLVDAAVGATQEGVEEGVQNIYSNVLARLGYDKTRQLHEGLVESVIGGAGSGGAMGALTSGRAQKLDKEIKSAVDNGVPPAAIDAMQDAIADEIAKKPEVIEKQLDDLKAGKLVAVEVEQTKQAEPTQEQPTQAVKPQEPANVNQDVKGVEASASVPEAEVKVEKTPSEIITSKGAVSTIETNLDPENVRSAYEKAYEGVSPELLKETLAKNESRLKGLSGKPRQAIEIENDVIRKKLEPKVEQTPVATEPQPKPAETAWEETKRKVAEMTAKAEAEKGQVKQGKVGMALGSGEVVLTSSGRKTTPFPQVKTGPRSSGQTLIAATKWLHDNAVAEAEARGDDYNASRFRNDKFQPKSQNGGWPQASKDSFEEYLFGEQPAVQRPITRPLTTQKPATENKMSVYEQVAWEKAGEVVDLRREPTGWKIISTDNGATIYNPKTGEKKTFNTDDLTSGTKAIAKRQEARAYAIDNSSQKPLAEQAVERPNPFNTGDTVYYLNAPNKEPQKISEVLPNGRVKIEGNPRIYDTEEFTYTAPRIPDAPVPGKQYQLTGTKGPSIASGNTWAESEVKPPAKNAELIKDMVEHFSNPGSIIKDALETRKLSEALFGGDPKSYYDELYDAMEMGLNRQFRVELLTTPGFKLKMDAAIKAEGMLPLRNRSLETIKNQQFSTPLSLATAANHLLSPQSGDIILEPTAGTGNLIVPFWNGDWKLIANELDPRRLEVLKHSGEVIDIQNQDFLKYNGPNPTAIISNPPFGGLSTGKYASFAADFEASNLDQRFIAKMLRLLPEGGRIAVITSQGTGSGASGSPFRKWLDKEHTFLASIASPEGAYKHRGSPTIGTALLMIEKGKKRGAVKPLIRESVSGWDEYVSIIDALKNQYPRLESGAILKSGRTGNNEIPNPTTPSVGTKPTGQPAGVPSRGGERGGSVEPVGKSPDRVASVPTEQPDGSRIVADDLEQGTANVGTGERPRPTGIQDRKIVGSFIQYKRHNTLPIVSPHPSTIVESQELASVNPPPLTYKPGKALESAYRNKKISDEQMDVVLQTIQSIAKGKGQLIADDVGVGKTREMAGIILDALDTGKANRVLYVTKSQEVLNNHIATDFSEVMTGKPGMPLPFQTVRLDGMPKLADQSNLPLSDKSLYTITRDKLKSGYKNVMDIGFDLVVFDEAHEWRPANEKQAKYIAWTAIHDAMRGKPMVYVTATPGIDLASLDYLYGLGEWSKGTFDQYIASITGQEAQKKGMFSGGSSFASAGSIPMTQQFMRELKMKGLYSSRDLSRQNVKFESRTVNFTPEDIAAYDRYTAFLLKAYKVGVKYAKFNKVSGAKGLGLIKSMMQNAAKRHQVDLKMTRIINDVKKDIADGKRVFLFTSGLNELDQDAPKGYVRAVIDAINENQVESVEGEVISDKIPESIEEKELLKDELNSLPPQLSIEKYVKENLGNKYKIGFYTGNTTESNKKKYLKEWMEGKIDVMLGSDAAKTAISAHDVIGKPITNYYLDVDFEVTKFKQALGRTNRAGEKSSPTIIIPGIGAAGEQKFIATIASRMKSLGATSKGQAESGVVDFLSEFDLDGAIAHQAARNTFSGINDTDKELFLNEKLYENIGGQRVPRRVPPQNYYVDQFLYDLNFMPYEDGNRMFKLLIENYKDILDKSARTAELIAERTGGTEVKQTELYRNPENPNDYVTLHEVLDKTGHRFGILSGMLLDKTKDLVRYEVRQFVKFQTPNGLISGKKVLPSHIVALAKSFGKDMASTITVDNAYDVIISGDKVPVGKEMDLYLRQDGAVGIKNAKMADKIILQKAGATFRPVGSAWVLKDKSKESVKEFIRSFPLRNTAAVEQSIVQESTGPDVIEMNIGVPLLPASQRRQVNDDIAGIRFSDPDTEMRYKAAKGVQLPGRIQQMKEFFTQLGNRMTRTYETLPNKPEYADLRQILSNQSVSKAVAQDRTIRAIDAITAGFGPNKMDLFTRKVLLDDLSRELADGRDIPFGFTATSLTTSKDNIDRLVEQNPDVKEAISKRNRLWEAITSELVQYGILKPEQLKENYFRHQVLEYARAKATYGTGKRLRKPSPGYAKRRKGSSMDINTDYVQTEFEVMAQAMTDIETARNIRKIENSPLNIKDQLKERAQDGESWRDMIPEGYTLWQPQEGNIFYTANSVPERIINQMLTDGMVGITGDDVKKVLAIGAKRKEFVVPDDVAVTLDNLYQVKNPNIINAAAQEVTRDWKRWVLFNPRRFLKYSLQNFTGDLDAVIAGRPGILKKFGEANQALLDVYYRGKPMPLEMREFFERGGLSAQMTVNELPELREMEIFNRLISNQVERKVSSLNPIRNYWNTVNTFNMYREGIFRYAAYLYYKENLAAGRNVGYGASVSTEIDNITDQRDKAAKLATELLGDYANITAFGKDMRESVAPFYSWMEINFKRYTRLTRNAFNEGAGAGVRLGVLSGTKGGIFLTRFMLRAAAMSAAVILYNMLRFQDEEDELSEYDKNRMHIVLGRNPDGTISILRSQGAFADMLEWFGLQEAPMLWKNYLDGKMSLVDIFGNIPWTNVPAFGLNPTAGRVGMHPAAMKIIRSINPLYKLPFETLTGQSLPVFGDSSWKIDDKTRNILRAVSLENEYDYFTGKASRGYGRSLAELMITTQDPLENAYRYIQGEKYKFLETVKGRGGSGDYYSPRSILYRQYKKALRLGDKKAEEKIKADMDAMGITNKELNQSLSSADPLHGLNKQDEQEFVNVYLSQYDRVKLQRAEEYYRKTFK
jgi:lysozyme family protein